MINKGAHILNVISIGLAHRRKILKIKNIDNNMTLFMYRNNLINNIYKINNYYHIKINLNVKLNVQNLSRSVGKLYISYNQILKKKIHLHPTIYILSSHTGILNQHEAIKKKCGGFLMGKILIG